jgi:hypothetical protein
VEHDRHQDHREQRGERPVHHEGQEREPEDVEADVLVVERVSHSEVLGVRQEQEVLPLADRARGRDERDYEREQRVEATRVGPDRAPEPSDELVFGGVEEQLGGTEAIAQEEVGPHCEEEEEPKGEEESELGLEHRGEHLVLVRRHVGYRRIPQRVREDRRDRPERECEDDEDREHHDNHDPTT